MEEEEYDDDDDDDAFVDFISCPISMWLFHRRIYRYSYMELVQTLGAVHAISRYGRLSTIYEEETAEECSRPPFIRAFLILFNLSLVCRKRFALYCRRFSYVLVLPNIFMIHQLLHCMLRCDRMRGTLSNRGQIAFRSSAYRVANAAVQHAWRCGRRWSTIAE